MKRAITIMIVVLTGLTTAMWLNAQQKWVGQIDRCAGSKRTIR
jgi:hypothetical protein